MYCAQVTGVLLDEWHDMFQSLMIVKHHRSVHTVSVMSYVLGATASQQ